MALNTYSLDLEDGSSQYASIVDNASLSIVGTLTIECWVKPESLTGVHTPVSKYNSTLDKGYMIWAYTAVGYKPTFVLSNDGSTNEEASADTALQAGVWQHIAVTYNTTGPVCTWYRNGAPDGTPAITLGSIFNNAADFAIGCRYLSGSADSFFDGLIDEVRVWNDVRSAAEIAAAYNRELTTAEIADANLKGYWKLNNDYLDETTNNNDLTASGSPVFSTTVPFVGGTTSNFFPLL